LRTKDKNAEIPTSNSTGQATKEIRQENEISNLDFLLLERRGERPVLSLTTQLATGLADGQEQVDHSTFWQPSFIPPGQNPEQRWRGVSLKEISETSLLFVQSVIFD
jgi:hypothetical protein